MESMEFGESLGRGLVPDTGELFLGTPALGSTALKVVCCCLQVHLCPQMVTAEESGSKEKREGVVQGGGDRVGGNQVQSGR